MNLHETLKQYNEVNVLPGQELIIKEAKSILANSEQKDISILSKLGMDKNIKKFEKIEEEKRQANNFGEIYDISVIKKMAVHYGLRFLPAALYKGTIDPVLPSILNDFISNNNISIVEKEKRIRISWLEDENYNDTGFYILAPASSFELQERPKDPIMFYKINNNKYAFVHKWGDDLSNSRLVLNYFKRSKQNACMLFSLVIVVSCIVSFILSHRFESFIALTFLLFNIFVCIEFTSNDEKWDSKYI